jgi:hypothetical protein
VIALSTLLGKLLGRTAAPAKLAQEVTAAEAALVVAQEQHDAAQAHADAKHAALIAAGTAYDASPDDEHAEGVAKARHVHDLAIIRCDGAAKLLEAAKSEAARTSLDAERAAATRELDKLNRTAARSRSALDEAARLVAASNPAETFAQVFDYFETKLGGG